MRGRGSSHIAFPAVVVASLCLLACSEKTRIYTQPPGANVQINGRDLGRAPVDLSVKSWSVRPNSYRYHVQMPGYVAQDGYIQPHLSIGRVIAAASTWCFTCSFHGFFEFDPETQIVLEREPPPSAEDPVAARLRRLNELHDQGLISDDELHQLRSDVLRALANPPGQPPHGHGPPGLPELLRQLFGPGAQPR
jgi:hypothetical protein